VTLAGQHASPAHDAALPYLTAGLPGTGGVIKARQEDFRVEEIPLYPASGEGTHVYAYIEKRGISTADAIARLAKALGRRRNDIGFAGLKDAKAVTRQWVSIEHVDTGGLLQLDIPYIKILEVTRHTNKIHLGHLEANRFRIRIRDMAMPLPEATAVAEQVLSILSEKGVPNFFGPQRFGNRHDGHLLGRAIVAGETEEFLGIFLGRPMGNENPVILSARQSYEKGDFEKAYLAWPRSYCEQRRALKALMATGGRKRAFQAVDMGTKRLFVSAYQSSIFNAVLAARMPRIDSLLLGDMAYLHVNGACFRVEDPQVEQPRCTAFEISPTGPIFGRRMTELTGPAGEIENPLLDEARQVTGGFKRLPRELAKGERRPLRFRPRSPEIASGRDDLGDWLELRFDLPSGCYATVVVREITKAHVM
jgi:tRNA pseudouridine13 synthase